jgi:hypothetical protein
MLPYVALAYQPNSGFTYNAEARRQPSHPVTVTKHSVCGLPCFATILWACWLCVLFFRIVCLRSCDHPSLRRVCPEYEPAFRRPYEAAGTFRRRQATEMYSPATSFCFCLVGSRRENFREIFFTTASPSTTSTTMSPSLWDDWPLRGQGSVVLAFQGPGLFQGMFAGMLWHFPALDRCVNYDKKTRHRFW